MVSSMSSLSSLTLGLIILTGALARLDTLSPTDYLTLAIDCKDSRIKVSYCFVHRIIEMTQTLSIKLHLRKYE